MFPQLTDDLFKGSPIESDYKRLSPTPNDFLDAKPQSE
jgi:hypothetical protein